MITSLAAECAGLPAGPAVRSLDYRRAPTLVDLTPNGLQQHITRSSIRSMASLCLTSGFRTATELFLSGVAGAAVGRYSTKLTAPSQGTGSVQSARLNRGCANCKACTQAYLQTKSSSKRGGRFRDSSMMLMPSPAAATGGLASDARLAAHINEKPLVRLGKP